MSRCWGLLLLACCACWRADWPTVGPLSRERGLPNPISLTSSHPATDRSPAAELSCSVDVRSTEEKRRPGLQLAPGVGSEGRDRWG